MDKNSYGYFDDGNREYVITRPDTPLPWINYLGSQDYFALISNTAGGYSFYQDARMRRISRYRYNNVPLDFGGRYIYLRNDSTGFFWSPTWQPITSTQLSDYTCRHGMGYTMIRSTFQGVTCQTRYFIPLEENLEIWDVTLLNNDETPAKLSVFSTIEFNLWDAWDDQTNFQRNFNTGEVEIDGNVIYHKTEYRERRDHFAYFACSENIIGYDTQREAFLGPYRDWRNPVAVEKGAVSNSHAHGWQPIGSHQVKVSLLPGETKRIIFILGYHQNPETQKFDPLDSQSINLSEVKPIISKFIQPTKVDAAFQALNHYWNDLLSVLTVKTPDQHVDRMVNIWNVYQNMVTFNLSRSASYFESGIGRGMGFRDSNQDLLGFIHLVPHRARQRILDLAATQLESGGAFHQYQPLTKRGNDAVGSNFNDDPLWLVLAVVAYIKETGDFLILDEPVQFENTPGSEQPLLFHLELSINYTLERLGTHGLPLIGRADWNDCLNLNCFSTTPGESFQTTTNREGNSAESVFIAGQFVLSCNEMAALIDQFSGSTLIKTRAKNPSSYYINAAVKMTDTIQEHGWDGEWFLRAYDYYGNKIGSKDCDEGRIFIESQGICIMAGVGIQDGSAITALGSVEKHLSTPHGIVLHQPAYTRYSPHLGEISSYPPGYKENAGIFCHTNPWIMIAEAMVGHGNKAMDYYLRINPSIRSEISHIHRCEPYVYAQMIAGVDAPTHGEAKNSWLTGTASYNFVAITQWILGIRPSYQGLCIAPIIPDSWQGFEVTRNFRGITYKIHVLRVGPGNEIALEVDGTPIQGNIIPLPQGTPVLVKVKARLGKEAS